MYKRQEYYQFKEEKNGGAPALTVNGTQMTIARYPDVGEVTIKRVIDSGLNGGSCFELQDTTPLNWKNTGRIYVRGSFWAEWWKTVGRITEINADQRSIKTNGYLGWSREGKMCIRDRSWRKKQKLRIMSIWTVRYRL